eukprot:351879-Chlamydomonas_euryale.AAC.29
MPVAMSSPGADSVLYTAGMLLCGGGGIKGRKGGGGEGEGGGKDSGTRMGILTPKRTRRDGREEANSCLGDARGSPA